MKDRVLQWVLSAQNDDGSFPDTYPGGKPYPEMGYLIPTLFQHDESFAALACADYLMKIQNDDGSFNGLDGIPRTFDTGACAWGLVSAYQHGCGKFFAHAADRAARWIEDQKMEDGFLRIHPGTAQSERYTVLAGAWANIGTDAWSEIPIGRERSHYVAYYLEGRSLLGQDIRRALEKSLEAVGANHLFPYWLEQGWKGDASEPCLTGSLQMARLYLLHGMKDEAEDIIAAAGAHRTRGGGMPTVPNGPPVMWAARYWLEATDLL